MKKYILPVFLVCALAFAAWADGNSVSPKLHTLRIHNAVKTHEFQITIATTEAEQNQGLMGKLYLPKNQGMLFPFDPPQVASMWMHNTPLPLDIIFIGPDYKISRIYTGIPHDQTPLPSPGPALAALEINGGLAKQLGIMVGDKVEWALD